MSSFLCSRSSYLRFFYTCTYIYIYTQTLPPTLVFGISISVQFRSSSAALYVFLEIFKNMCSDQLKLPLQEGIIRTDLSFVLKIVINSSVEYSMHFLSKIQMLHGG